MYKIAQNLPVIVKQPSLITFNLLKIVQGSIYFCTKVKLQECTNEFETQVSKHKTKSSNKKESGKNIEENTPPVIYLSETPTSSCPLDDSQFHVNNLNNENDLNVSNNIQPKSDVISLYDKIDDYHDEKHDKNLSGKVSNSVLQQTELSNNDVTNVTKSELNQEPEKKKWGWNMYQFQKLNQDHISSEKPSNTIVDENRGHNESKNLYTQSNLESTKVSHSESSTINNKPHVIRLEPCKMEILSSSDVKTLNKKWRNEQIDENLKTFTPPPKDDHQTNYCFVSDQNHRSDTKKKRALGTSNNNIQFKKPQPIPKIKARNPLKLQNLVTFKGKPSSVPINPNITFTNPVIETLRENRLVNPSKGPSFFQKMAIDPLLKSNNDKQKTSGGDNINTNSTKSTMTPIPHKKDNKLSKDTKIPLFSPNPEIKKVLNRTIAQNTDLYKHLFPASTTTSSNKTANVALPSRATATITLPSKTTTVAPSNKATVTPLNKISTNIAPANKITTVIPPSKTAIVPPSNNSIVTPSSKPTTVTPSSKTTTITPSSKTTTVISSNKTTTATPSNKALPPLSKTIVTPITKTLSPTIGSQQQTKNHPKTNTSKASILSQEVNATSGVQFQIPGRLLIAFTCKKCNTRNSKKITKHAYTKGVVIIRCDGCNNNHLIADNLNWFTDIGKKRNIEDIMAEKGEKVKKVDLPGGISEYLTES